MSLPRSCLKKDRVLKKDRKKNLFYTYDVIADKNLFRPQRTKVAPSFAKGRERKNKFPNAGHGISGQ